MTELQGDDPRFAVVVVLFEPTWDVVRRVVGSAALTPIMIAVDNSVAVDRTKHDELTAAGVVVISNANRGGLAGAYNCGVGEAIRRDAVAVFFLDQDSDIGPTFFRDMLRPVRDQVHRAVVVGATIYEIRMGITMPVHPPDQDLRGGQFADPALVPASFVISSGSLISRAALLQLQDFREDFFIEWLDVEMSLRAQRLGIPVLMNRDAVVRQMTGDMTQHGRRFTTNHPAWRKYYRVRNMVLVSREYGFGRGGRFGAFARGLQEASVVARFEQGRRRKVVAIVVGLLDGLRGRSGRFEARHPRTHRFCTD